jgi:NADH:ubiquinone oxidoreductase subunit 6 (subunit J)
MAHLILFLIAIYIFLFIFCVIQEKTFLMVFSLIMVFIVACFLVITLKFEFLGFLILIIYVGAIAVLFLFMVMLFDRAEYKIFNFKKISKFYKIFSFFLSMLLTFIVLFFLFEVLHSTIESENSGYSSFYEKNNYFLFKSYLTFLNNNYLNRDIELIFFSDILKSLDFLQNLSTEVNSIDISVINNFFLQDDSYIYIKKFLGHDLLNNKKSNFTDIELVGLNLYYNYFIILFIGGLGLLVAMIGCILITKSSILNKIPRKSQIIEEQLSRFKI